MNARQWNEEENGRLLGLSLHARVLYLQVFRWKMDYSTGIAGGLRGKNIIDYRSIVRDLEFVPDHGSRRPPWRPSKEEVRAAVRELERAGLLVDKGSCKALGLVKLLPCATVGKSVQNVNPAGTPQEPRRTNPAGTPQDESNNNSDLDGLSTGVNPRGTPQEGDGVNPTHPVSGNKQQSSRGDRSVIPRARVDGDSVFMTATHVFDMQAVEVHLRMMGVCMAKAFDDKALEAVVGEFRSYWVTQEREFRLPQWDQKLAKAIKWANENSRGDGDAKAGQQVRRTTGAAQFHETLKGIVRRGCRDDLFEDAGEVRPQVDESVSDRRVDTSGSGGVVVLPRRVDAG